uniref:Uncharacterized protein n=1 Tax=Cacopsylla melanoneura TaxID=428564 RepID=A0A8D8TUT3_9HEMI
MDLCNTGLNSGINYDVDGIKGNGYKETERTGCHEHHGHDGGELQFISYKSFIISNLQVHCTVYSVQIDRLQGHIKHKGLMKHGDLQDGIGGEVSIPAPHNQRTG